MTTCERCGKRLDSPARFCGPGCAVASLRATEGGKWRLTGHDPVEWARTKRRLEFARYLVKSGRLVPGED